MLNPYLIVTNSFKNIHRVGVYLNKYPFILDWYTAIYWCAKLDIYDVEVDDVSFPKQEAKKFVKFKMEDTNDDL